MPCMLLLYPRYARCSSCHSLFACACLSVLLFTWVVVARGAKFASLTCSLIMQWTGLSVANGHMHPLLSLSVSLANTLMASSGKYLNQMSRNHFRTRIEFVTYEFILLIPCNAQINQLYHSWSLWCGERVFGWWSLVSSAVIGMRSWSVCLITNDLEPQVFALIVFKR